MLVALAAVVAACTPAGPEETEGEPAGQRPEAAVACWGVPAPVCARVAEEALAVAPAELGPVVHVVVRDGRIDLVGADGGGRASTRFVQAGDGRLEWDVWSVSAVGPMRPVSGPALGAIVALTLGHCGLDSPIDVDGSFWDPVGEIPADDALLGDAAGQFRRLGPTSAEFVTARGARVALQLHVGAASPAGCD